MRFIKDLSHALPNFMAEEEGVSLIEFALVGLLVGVVCLLAFLAFGKNN